MTHKRTAPTAEPPPVDPKLRSVAADHASLQIGEVAERTGVTQRTLRFYEEKGLLKPPSRLDGGFRLYSEEDIERVEQIKRLQSLLGFSLSEIKDMVEAEEVKSQIKATYRKDAEISKRRAKIVRAKEVTVGQVTVIDQKLAALHDMKSNLEAKLAQYDTWLQHLEEQARAQTAK